jgi:hypothetical protein
MAHLKEDIASFQNLAELLQIDEYLLHCIISKRSEKPGVTRASFFQQVNQI